MEIGGWITSLGFIKSIRSMFQWRAEKEIIFASCLGMDRMILQMGFCSKENQLEQYTEKLIRNEKLMRN